MSKKKTYNAPLKAGLYWVGEYRNRFNLMASVVGCYPFLHIEWVFNFRTAQVLRASDIPDPLKLCWGPKVNIPLTPQTLAEIEEDIRLENEKSEQESKINIDNESVL